MREPCAALNQLRAEGFDVREEDVACLSPLGFEHINILGRYAFTLPSHAANSGPCETQPHAAPMPTSQPLHRFYVPLHPRPQPQRDGQSVPYQCTGRVYLDGTITAWCAGWSTI